MTPKEYTLRYREMGLSVIPVCTPDELTRLCLYHGSSCMSPGCRPMVRWKEYQKVLPTEGEISRWWNEWPKANIAVITGDVSGVCALHTDAPRPLAVEWYGPITDSCIAFQRDTMKTSIFYRWSRPVGSTVDPFPSGPVGGMNRVFRFGDRRTVLLPPSLVIVGSYTIPWAWGDMDSAVLSGSMKRLLLDPPVVLTSRSVSIGRTIQDNMLDRKPPPYRDVIPRMRQVQRETVQQEVMIPYELAANDFDGLQKIAAETGVPVMTVPVSREDLDRMLSFVQEPADRSAALRAATSDRDFLRTISGMVGQFLEPAPPDSARAREYQLMLQQRRLQLAQADAGRVSQRTLLAAFGFEDEPPSPDPAVAEKEGTEEEKPAEPQPRRRMSWDD